MHIDVVPNRGSKPAILLREAWREGNRTLKRTVANLSSWPPARVEALRATLRGDFDGVSAEPAVADRVFGVLFVLSQLADRCGLSKALGRSELARLVGFLVLARLAHQRSRLSAVRWATNHAVTELLGLEAFSEDALYSALAWAAQHQAAIELKLFRDFCARGGQPPRLVLYDVTSVYLEGEHNALAAFGYNRDKKAGKRQIVVGLLAASDGEPLAVRVFAGNTNDTDTVDEQLRTLAEDFGVKDVVFVGDRGMVKARGKAAIQKLSMSYITALTNAQIRTLIKRDVIQPSLFDEKLCEVEADGKRFVLRRNDARVHKEAMRREDKLATLKARIARRNDFVAEHPRAVGETGLNTLNKLARKLKLSDVVTLSLHDKTVQLHIDPDASARAAQLDGCYVLETDVPVDHLSTEQVNEAYGRLQKVERDFRTMKTTLLEVRPLYVRRDDHTRGAIFVTMLALKLQRRLESALESMPVGNSTSVRDALDTLARWTFIKRNYAGVETLELPTPDRAIQALLDALQIEAPKQPRARTAPSRKTAKRVT